MSGRMHEYLDWIDRWVLAEDPDGRLASEQAYFGTNGTHALGFVYVDHQAGMSLHVDSYCNLGDDGRLKLLGGPRQKNVMSILRYDLFSKMKIIPLDEKERERLELPEHPDWLSIYQHAGAEPARKLTFIDPLRAEGYPDVIKFIIPADAEHHIEQGWGRIERPVGEHSFVCVLLTEPDQDFGFHAGEQVIVLVKEVPEGLISAFMDLLSVYPGL